MEYLRTTWNSIKDEFGDLWNVRTKSEDLITLVTSIKNQAQFMDIVTAFVRNNVDKGIYLEHNVKTDNFLVVLMDALNTDKYWLAPNLFTVVGKIFVLLSRLCPIIRTRLIELNIAEKFVGLIENMDELELINADEELEFIFRNTNFEFSIAHLLIYFLPKVSNDNWFSQAINCLHSYEMIEDFDGDVHYTYNIMKPFISTTFMTVYRICQKPAYLDCYSYHVLLMKMTYWALHLDTCDLSGIGIANYLKMALNSDCKRTVLSAVGIIDFILHKFPMNTVEELCTAGISHELHNLKWGVKMESTVTDVGILANLHGKILAMEAKLMFAAEIYFNPSKDTSSTNASTNYVDIKTSQLNDESRILADLVNSMSDPEKMKQYKESEVIDFLFRFIMIRTNDDKLNEDNYYSGLNKIAEKCKETILGPRIVSVSLKPNGVHYKLMEERYSKLNQFMTAVLNLDNKAKHRHGILKVDPKGIDNFRHVVLYINNFLEKQAIKEIYPCDLETDDKYAQPPSYEEDNLGTEQWSPHKIVQLSKIESMLKSSEKGQKILKELFRSDSEKEDQYGRLPRSYEKVNLGLERWPPITRVLGRSKYESLLKSSSQLKAHRLKSILVVVNEHWGVLFQNLVTERLIPVDLFTNKAMVNKLNEVMKSAQSIPPVWVICYACDFNHCQYTLPLEMRIYLLKCINKLSEFYNTVDKDLKPIIHRFQRDKPVAQVANNLNQFRDITRRWSIVYENVLGSGPTKEFYTEFSRDCYRKELNIWIDDESSSNDYINPSAGLFPSPCPMSKESENSLKAIGLVFNKAILDSELLNINFSETFLKRLFAYNYHSIKLTDLKHVVPSVYAFAEKLVDVIKLKQMIMESESLTPKQKSEAVEALKVDGRSFKDIAIKFTLPRYPHIEMICGGKNVMLSPTNIEDYLKLLIWWYLFDGPAKKFTMLLHSDCENACKKDLIYTSLFRFDELTELFFGQSNFSDWSIEILTENCKLVDPLSRESPLIKYLFKVLTDLTQIEKERFLEFVTCSPTIPRGGFKDLSPPLTISIIDTDKPDDRLPTAFTCLNLLQIPNYSSAEVLKERLQLAISEGLRRFDSM